LSGSFGRPCYMGPCHHGMARPRVVEGGDGLKIWRVATNILNKQSRTADKGWFSSLEVGRGADNSLPSKTLSCNVTEGLRIGGNAVMNLQVP
jgi:hypothetical protein